MLVATVIALASSMFVLVQPARAIAAPQRAEVHYASTYAEVRWAAVADATSYAIEVSKVGFYGPWRRWATNSATTAIRSVVLTRSQGSGVSAADSQKAATKVNSCLKQGLAAAAAAGATSGVIAIGTAWIPGVNAVTAGSVASAVGGAAASRYIVCALPW